MTDQVAGLDRSDCSGGPNLLGRLPTGPVEERVAGKDLSRTALVAAAEAVAKILRGRELEMPVHPEPRYLRAWLVHELLVHTPRILFAIALLQASRRL
jgi:hypothetical protein